MYAILKGMRVVEGASFVAAPLCGLTFVQLGADVIRFDPIRGGPDFKRWPVSSSTGTSFYWEGLNKGKRSIAIDLSSPVGRELAVELASAGGEDAGHFVTNYPENSFLSYKTLSNRRSDLISVRVAGSSDGKNAVDYTINCATGYPYLTGAPGANEPVNHVFPAWDVAAGFMAALCLLAADRDRARTGKGSEIVLPLSNVAFAMLGNLGHLAEVQASGADRQRTGNALFGSFGRDFMSADEKRVMIVAITERQWAGLVRSLNLEAEVVALEHQHTVNFLKDEGARYVHRQKLFALVGARVARLRLHELEALFDKNGVGWGSYHTVREALLHDKRLSVENPLFQMRSHPSGAEYLTPGFPAELRGEDRSEIKVAPRLGEHTDEILSEIIGLSSGKIGDLHDAGVVAGPEQGRIYS